MVKPPHWGRDHNGGKAWAGYEGIQRSSLDRLHETKWHIHGPWGHLVAGGWGALWWVASGRFSVLEQCYWTCGFRNVLLTDSMEAGVPVVKSRVCEIKRWEWPQVWFWCHWADSKSLQSERRHGTRDYLWDVQWHLDLRLDKNVEGQYAFGNYFVYSHGSGWLCQIEEKVRGTLGF